MNKAPIAFVLSFVFLFFPISVFSSDDFFRQTKESYTPDPYLQPDLSSGGFNYSILITVPPGRPKQQ